ncbi:unnamed protein product (macronuclear) [Paramecium tetraurelia]|uniref:ADP,ATP carrier protein n=1 Tax=Paramecium tetraurelia TaxID=5888 RepID=A0EGA0_PARTE|nr:uncharacterized protein GSPATT00026665001 [Paramecium tetraurelia]CAK94341.1 unnamed protein product [Paramecium tetraurelia]|eukprot:XP_001461714.1 hypothetical protein (macronuclear) [Paramecium tetraurelia strain d4-2]
MNYPETKQYRRLTFWKCMAVTTFSYAVSKTATAPLERVKLILQVSPILKCEDKIDRTWSGIKQIYKTQGLYSFWRGNGLNVIKTIPNAAIRFTVYDKFKQYVSEYRQKENYTRQVTNRLVAGFCTGLLNQLIHYPLEVLRVKLTVDMSHFNKARLYNGIFDCLKKTLKTQGFSALYQGFILSSCGTVPYLGISFLVHDQLKDLVPIENKSEQIWMQLAQFIGIGSISTITATALTYPIDTIRRRIQINGSLGAQRAYVSFSDCVKKMRKEGLLSYYRGFWITLVRVVPAATIQFGCFDYLRELST